jgi:hypothetical protein
MNPNTERWRKLRDRRREQGLCSKCGQIKPHLCPALSSAHDCRDRWRREGRCVSNGCKLPKGSLFKCCARCRRKSRERYNPKDRRNGPQNRKQRPYESPQWKALDTAGRCSCGLLLPCGNCLPSSAAELAENRSGPGRVLP